MERVGIKLNKLCGLITDTNKLENQIIDFTHA